MQFPTLLFGLFFLTVFACTWATRDNERRKIILLCASWLFYGSLGWRFVPLLIGSAAGNWMVARALGALRPGRLRRTVLAASVTANLGVLAYCKYFGFFSEQAAGIAAWTGWSTDWPLVQVLLPVGVSFYTFQAVSYIVDVARGRCAPAALLDVALLMSFFAHLAAGPIVRAVDLIPQFAQTPRLTRAAASEALVLILWGLFKKVVIASPLGVDLVDPVFADPSAYGGVDVLAAAYGFAVEIFCDFSAYSDMAIGFAALLGYTFPKNFDQPYRAGSLQEFWRRWHISLSSWLRDYLYVPLGGSRHGLALTCLNLLITMGLGGLWHGPKWTFVAWGALHGAGLCAERIGRALHLPLPPRLLGVIITFHVVLVGWVFFKADDWRAASAVFEALGRWATPISAATPFCVALTGVGLAIHFMPRDWLARLGQIAARLPGPAFASAFALSLMVIDAQRPEGVPPFLYVQF